MNCQKPTSEEDHEIFLYFYDIYIYYSYTKSLLAL